MKLVGFMFIGLGVGYILYMALNLPSLPQGIVGGRLLTGVVFILVGVIIFFIPSRPKSQ